MAVPHFDPDRLMHAAQQQIEHYQRRAANREPDWDGYCGLVKVCEDTSFREVEPSLRGSPAPSQSSDSRSGAPSVHVWRKEHEGLLTHRSAGSIAHTPLTMVPEDDQQERLHPARQASATGQQGHTNSLATAAHNFQPGERCPIQDSKLADTDRPWPVPTDGIGGQVFAVDAAPPAQSCADTEATADKHNAAAVSSSYENTVDLGLSAELSARLTQLRKSPRTAGRDAEIATIADIAYRYGVRCAEQGASTGAVEFLTVALDACPSTKPRAVAKITAMLKQLQLQANVAD